MGAVDPTYPLYPIASLIASTMLLLVLTTSFVRQSWNLGVTFLCFWLFFENATGAVNHIVWFNNADIKLYVYCDIVTHLQLITFVVKPMATLVITRRLYLIASLQSVELPNKATRRWNLALEWTLGLIMPILVAGPIYYVNQGTRFEVFEGFGCRSADESSIFDTMIQQSWSVVPPLISTVFYYPKVARAYYRQKRDIDSFLRSNSSISRTNYLRILVLASIDILLTLPIGIVSTTLDIVQARSLNHFHFYPGWTPLHTDWEPDSVPYTEIQAAGTAELAQSYFSQWSSPVLAFVIFGLFGVTPEARASYWRIICTVGGWFGWKPAAPRARNGQTSLGDIEFGVRPQDASGIDLEMGSRTPSFINTNAPDANQNIERVLNGRATARQSVSSVKSAHRDENDIAKIEDTEGNISAVEVQDQSASGESGPLGTDQDGKMKGGSTPGELDLSETREAVDRTFGDSDNRWAIKAGQSTAA